MMNSELGKLEEEGKVVVGRVCDRSSGLERRERPMAHALKTLRVPPSSANMEEARRRTFEFFKMACRSIPSVMEIYNLRDVVVESQLRSTIAAEIRKNAHITNHKVIDLLLFKGTEELSNIVTHSKQRHHIIGQYVVRREGLAQDMGTKDLGTSEFLKQFYTTNYF